MTKTKKIEILKKRKRKKKLSRKIWGDKESKWKKRSSKLLRKREDEFKG